MWVLFTVKFDFCAFLAPKLLRDVQWKVKKFCEASDNKIERALQRACERENRSLTTDS